MIVVIKSTRCGLAMLVRVDEARADRATLPSGLVRKAKQCNMLNYFRIT